MRDKYEKLIDSDGNTGYKKGCVRKYVILWESICNIILYNISGKTRTSIHRSKHGVKTILSQLYGEIVKNKSSKF